MKKECSQEVIGEIKSPIGLNIGAETPEEIGVAIMAEIIEVKNQNKRVCGYPKDLLEAILDIVIRERRCLQRSLQERVLHQEMWDPRC